MAAGLRVGIEASTGTVKRSGLLVPSNVIIEGKTEGAVRIGGGIEYEIDTCGPERSGTLGVCSDGPKDIADGPGTALWDPFLLWAGDKCSTLGSTNRNWAARAQRNLVLCEERLIESEVWLGTIAQEDSDTPNNKWLASADADVLTAAPIDPAVAIAFMDAAIAGCSCANGFIHAYVGFIAEANERSVLRREGNVWLTPHGNAVVEGRGYDGSGPAGEQAQEGSRWIYATGPVTVRLGPIKMVPSTLAEATNRSLNIAEFRAEREALYHWDCCHLAAEIDSAFPAPSVGGPGS